MVNADFSCFGHIEQSCYWTVTFLQSVLDEETLSPKNRIFEKNISIENIAL